MTAAQLIAREQAKMDAEQVRILRQVKKTGRLAWKHAETYLAWGLIEGAMQNYALTPKGRLTLFNLTDDYHGGPTISDVVSGNDRGPWA